MATAQSGVGGRGGIHNEGALSLCRVDPREAPVEQAACLSQAFPITEVEEQAQQAQTNRLLTQGFKWWHHLQRWEEGRG